MVIATVRSEWVKLRSVRLHFVLALIGIVIPLAVVVLTAIFAGTDSVDARDLASLVTGSSVVTALMVGVIGATGITSEYGFGTIRVTFTATPRRIRVVAAKMIVAALVAIVVQTVVVVVSFVAGAVLLDARGAEVDVSGQLGGVLPALVGMVAFSSIMAWLGLGLGLVVRATPAAVAILVLWPLLVESLIGAILVAAGADDAFDWLPYAAGFGLIALDPGGQPLGRIGGGLYFAAWTLAVVGAGAVLAQRRDA